MFDLLVAPPRQPRTLSVAGAGIVAGLLREAVSRRQSLSPDHATHQNAVAPGASFVPWIMRLSVPDRAIPAGTPGGPDGPGGATVGRRSPRSY